MPKIVTLFVVVLCKYAFRKADVRFYNKTDLRFQKNRTPYFFF